MTGNTHSTDGQVRLSIPVPPMLEEALGYQETARYVGFYWGVGDESYVNDGRCMTTGEWDAFLLFVRHRSVEWHLHGYDLGSSEDEARHWLILDREERLLSVAPAVIAQQVLQGQWKQPETEPVLVVDEAEWAQLVQELQIRMKTIGQNQVLALMQQHQIVAQDLAAWLEAKWREQDSMRSTPQPQGKPTLNDIKALATQLEFDFRGGGEQDGTFDLDKRGDRSTGGTWNKNQAGIEDAYGYLIRYRHQLAQIDQARGQL